MSDEPWLLVSDIDDTLTGDDHSLRELLALAAGGGPFRLVFNSSRPRESVRKTLEFFPGDYPESMITAMGTEMMVDGEVVTTWEERFAGWDRRLIEQVVLPLGGVLHADEYQTSYKASFAVEADRQESVREAISVCGQDSQVIVSGTSDVDVLPPGAGKGEATLFLARLLGIDLAKRLVVAGDSGNDLAMFAVSPRGVLVGNARAELRDAVLPETSYQAVAPHAAGVLEGLRNWKVISAS